MVLPIACSFLGEPFVELIIAPYYKILGGNDIESYLISNGVFFYFSLAMANIPWLLGITYHFGKLTYKQLILMAFVFPLFGVLAIIFRMFYAISFMIMFFEEEYFAAFFLAGLILGSIIGILFFKRRNRVKRKPPLNLIIDK